MLTFPVLSKKSKEKLEKMGVTSFPNHIKEVHFEVFTKWRVLQKDNLPNATLLDKWGEFSLLQDVQAQSVLTFDFAIEQVIKNPTNLPKPREFLCK